MSAQPEVWRVSTIEGIFEANLETGAIISVITSPLALPFMGNLFGNFINATFTFYFSLVVACILGLSLFKCADRLGIQLD
jgi:hypothetical protein